jgi:hypothetical protein
MEELSPYEKLFLNLKNSSVNQDQCAGWKLAQMVFYLVHGLPIESQPLFWPIAELVFCLTLAQRCDARRSAWMW